MSLTTDLVHSDGTGYVDGNTPTVAHREHLRQPFFNMATSNRQRELSMHNGPVWRSDIYIHTSHSLPRSWSLASGDVMHTVTPHILTSSFLTSNVC